MKRSICLFGAPLLVGLCAAAATTDGLSSPFLTLGAGARAAGLGQAYTAIANDATAVYWNPAGLPFLDRRTATLMHGSLLGAALSYDHVAVGQRWGRRGGIGLGVQHLSAGGLVLSDAGGGRQGEFKPRDVAASLSLAGQWRGAALGATVKWIRRQIVDSAQTAAFDVGVLTPFYFGNRLRFGLASTNLGGALRFNQVDEEIPATHRGGAVWRFSPATFLSVDAEKKTGASLALRSGVEYTLDGPKGSLAFRAGFDSALTEDDGALGATAGFGVGFQNLKIDYALVPHRESQMSHTVSLSTWF